LVVTSQSRVELDAILNIRSFDWQRTFATVDDADHAMPQHEHEHEHEHEHGSDHDVSCSQCTDASSKSCLHEPEVSTYNFQIDAPHGADLATLHREIGTLLWDKPNGIEVFRLKGMVSVAGCDFKYALQGVHEIFELTQTTVPWRLDERRYIHVVCIGRSLDEAALRDAFQRCCAAASATASNTR